MSRPYIRNQNGIHSHNALSWVIELLGGKFYLATIAIRPTTVTIYNVSTTDASLTTIASGLTGVLKWRLTEKSGNDFYYCFDGIGTTYVTGFGWVSEDTAPTGFYVKRPSGTNVDMQLTVWTA